MAVTVITIWQLNLIYSGIIEAIIQQVNVVAVVTTHVFHKEKTREFRHTRYTRYARCAGSGEL